MRCPDCNKFVSFDTDSDPEIISVDVENNDDGTAEVSAEFSIVNNCAECGTELKGAEFSAGVTIELGEGHAGEGHELSVDEDGAQRCDRIQTGTMKKLKDGTEKFIAWKPRYHVNYYGAEVSFTVTCECGATWSDSIIAEVTGSSMDELV